MKRLDRGWEMETRAQKPLWEAMLVTGTVQNIVFERELAAEQCFWSVCGECSWL